MAKSKLNPFASLVAWGKRLILESIARELAEEATEATGYQIEALNLQHGADVPAITYSEE